MKIRLNPESLKSKLLRMANDANVFVHPRVTNISYMVWVCCLEVGKRRIWHSLKNLAVTVMTARHPNGNALLLVILSLCSCQSNALPRRELSSWGTIHFYLGWHGGQSIGSNTRNGFVIVCLWGIDHHSPFCWHVHKELRMHLAGSRLSISK